MLCYPDKTEDVVYCGTEREREQYRHRFSCAHTAFCIMGKGVSCDIKSFGGAVRPGENGRPARRGNGAGALLLSGGKWRLAPPRSAKGTGGTQDGLF